LQAGGAPLARGMRAVKFLLPKCELLLPKHLKYFLGVTSGFNESVQQIARMEFYWRIGVLLKNCSFEWSSPGKST